MCEAETHLRTVIGLFELPGCDVARLCCRDLFQIAKGGSGVTGCTCGRFLSGKSNPTVGIKRNNMEHDSLKENLDVLGEVFNHF